jgi:hypothetical protein
MIAHSWQELLWVFGTAFAAGGGWSLGCWVIGRLVVLGDRKG